MPDDKVARLTAALTADTSSARLEAALTAGTYADPAYVDALVARCAIEPDFFVRDMLTWALTRHPADATVPRLIAETTSVFPQARSQALHSLSKIRDPASYSAITPALLHDTEIEVARAAWRTAVILAPESERGALASELALHLGRGELETQRSLSRALAELGVPAAALRSRDRDIRIHAAATQRLIDDPDSDFAAAVEEARRLDIAASEPE